MSIASPTPEIDYPESDGQPMGETDLHRLWMRRIFDWLEYRYRGRKVYVGSDMLLYYVEGQPTRFVVPDVFVVLDCDPHLRRVWQTWVEGRAPNFVVEVTSKYTRHNDETFKPKYYAEMGVQELFLYDPTADYLAPPLQGYRLQNFVLARIPPAADGSLDSHELDVTLRLRGRRLVMHDRQTGRPLLTEADAHQQARRAERKARLAEKKARLAEKQARLAEEQARLAAEARAAAAEAEVERLRRQLRDRDAG